MPAELRLAAGQHSDKGRKDINQDCHGIRIPLQPLLRTKGIAVALADGISSSGVSQIASHTAVTGFLQDYYCTPESWSVKTSAERVLSATNAWLHAQTLQGQSRYDKDKGYVCTFSALIIKSHTAHLFHVGDSRIYRLRDNTLEQLTTDHRIWVSNAQSYLSRALGISAGLDIDYLTLPVALGDVFVLATDGVYDYLDATVLIDAINVDPDNLERAAQAIVATALARSSNDNLTIQLLRVDELPSQQPHELQQQLATLQKPPPLDARVQFDGYTIVRELHASNRSHVVLATDNDSGMAVVIKTPSIELQNNPAALERFLLEEWVARRIDNAHVVRAIVQERTRSYLYVATEFIDGQSLAQWMIDNPQPELETVRRIVEQIAIGLRALHRRDMLHQDLRPENVMIDATDTIKIIDFGAVRIAGVAEDALPGSDTDILGTTQYTAPEYFLGEAGTTCSDLFSLGVITYQMLTGRLPYGAEVAKCRTRLAQKNLRYESALEDKRAIPAWVDDVLKKAVHPDPAKRTAELSEFIADLRRPSAEFLGKTRAPLLERNPLIFWQSVSALLAVAVISLLITLWHRWKNFVSQPSMLLLQPRSIRSQSSPARRALLRLSQPSARVASSPAASVHQRLPHCLAPA